MSGVPRTSSDSYADLEKRYASDAQDEPGTNAYGCVKQLYTLKQQNRHMKVLLSIGGWTYSAKFAPVASSAAGRARFAASAVQLVRDWGLDGVDIDWEYPADAGQAADFVALLRACRAALDAYAAQSAPGYRFAITVAAPAGPQHYGVLDLAAMDPLVDGWHLMTYDYAGPWDATSGHQANLHVNNGTVTGTAVADDDGGGGNATDTATTTTTDDGPGTPPIAGRDTATAAAAAAQEAARLSTKYSTDRALDDYVARGVAPAKLALGLPLYGRAFAQTGGLGQAFSGTGDDGSDKDGGVWPYKSLPRAGAAELYDAVAGASYSYDAAARELVSYDSAASARAKAAYLRGRGMRGAFFWDASGDRAGPDSLVATVAAALGSLDADANWLAYPESRYDNIRNAMGAAAAAGTSAPAAPATVAATAGVAQTA